MANRRLSVLLWLVIANLGLARGRADEMPPNVVLIVADDLGWADLGCYGSTFHRTPHLDALAKTGKRFTQAYSAAPVCSPSRAAMLTGKHPARLHLTDWLPGRPDQASQKLLRPKILQHLPSEEVTLAEVLKSRGYVTGHIGKWHLGPRGAGPTDQGFDVNIAGDESGSPMSYFAPFSRSGKNMPGLDQAPKGQYLTDRLTDEAEKFIEANKARPFFLYLPHYAPHLPMVAKPEFVAKYPRWDGVPHGRQENPIYAAMLESLDESVGRIVSHLKSAGLSERTIVVFTSDNGGLAVREGANSPATNNAPLRESKGFLYEGGIRVPLIVNWPGAIGAGVETTPVATTDLFPTLKQMTGGDAAATDGLSLASLLKDRQPLAPRELYWHYPHYSNQGGKPGSAIRDGDWKLVEDYETGRRELFHIGQEVSESRNLADVEPQRVEAMAAKLAAWRTSVGAQSNTPNPAFASNPQAEDGTITLPASTAEVHGVMLRYEPLPHKNTLGFWVRPNDWASWEFDVSRPGVFEVEALVGCGAGSGGSTVTFQFPGQTLTLIVPVTGGFQNFQTQKLGRVTIDRAGRTRLEVHATRKPGAAVMDLREVKLLPAK
jgi:arylsulfatase A-like enzyme